MEQSLGHIRITFTDDEINRVLSESRSGGTAFTRHFNHAEEFFVRLGTPLVTPAFPIHHDVRIKEPAAVYLSALRTFVSQVHELMPELLGGLTYLFDPAEIQRPAFFKVYRAAERHFLYIVRLDLTYRPQIHTVIERGTNDTSPVYRSFELFLEADMLPLARVEGSGSVITGCIVDQLISDTWIGETGRGYLVQGIWLDAELNKFFSKLFIPTGRRLYPYYPYTSKFRTVSHSVIDLSHDGKRAAVGALHRAREFLQPHIEAIQEVLKREAFSEQLPLFAQLRDSVPAALMRPFESIKMQLYLNEQDMREFEVATNQST